MSEQAWAAGFWDGEGCVTADRRHLTPVLAVTQAGDEGEELCARFWAAIKVKSGGLYLRKDMRAGRGEIWRYSVSGAEAVATALETCRPWLSRTKIAQAEKALQAHAERKAAYVHPNAQKTHCKNGHAYDETNTRRDPDGRRHCRTCRRGSYLRQLAKQEAARTEERQQEAE